MRRSKRLAEQSVEEDDTETAGILQLTRAEGQGKATRPVEAGPDTGSGLAEEDIDSEDQQLDEGNTTEEDPGQDAEGYPELDDFEEDARVAVDALQEAVAEPAAFLRPSSIISELARHAARVSNTCVYLPRRVPPHIPFSVRMTAYHMAVY